MPAPHVALRARRLLEKGSVAVPSILIAAPSAHAVPHTSCLSLCLPEFCILLLIESRPPMKALQLLLLTPSFAPTLQYNIR